MISTATVERRTILHHAVVTVSIAAAAWLSGESLLPWVGFLALVLGAFHLGSWAQRRRPDVSSFDRLVWLAWYAPAVGLALVGFERFR